MDRQVQTINQAILAAFDAYAHKTCLKIKQGDHYRDISYAAFREMTFRLVKFLRSQGVSRGERVALALPNCLEWLAFYMATLLAGGVATPLRSSLALETLHFTLEETGACLAILDRADYIKAIAGRIDSTGDQALPALKTVVSLTKLNEAPANVIPLSAILTNIFAPTPAEIETFRAQAVALPPEALAFIKYTSGEADRPKGAVFDQSQLLKMARQPAGWFELDQDEVLFTILAWSYTASLKISLHCFLSGATNALPDRSESIAEDMQHTSPAATINMPRFFERFYEEVMEDFTTKVPEASPEVFRWAIAKGKEYLAAGAAASPELRQSYLQADKTFFTKIRGRIGGQMRYLCSTGAPLSQTLVDFFEVIGLAPLNVYNLTEAGNFPAVSRPDARRPGACGQIAAGFEARIAEDGEILLRGETVMREYWGRPEETRRVIDAEGWLHSGDLGYLDDEGYLYLTGRKQPTETLSTGRKINPLVIEKALTATPLIDRAVVCGDGRPYVSAIIVPDLGAFGNLFQEDDDTLPLAAGSEPLQWFWPRENIASAPMVTEAHPRIKLLLDKIIDRVNSRLDDWEQIKKYCLLDQAFSPTANALADLMAGDRSRLREHYLPQIDLMYPTAPLVEAGQIEQVEVTPERMRDLLEKENILDAWIADAGIRFLIRLAEEKQIDAPAMVHICDVAAMIAQLENEERPLSTAIIVGDPARIGRVLPPGQIQLLRHDHIRRMRGVLTTLAKIVDGMVLGYVLDRHGYVRGIHNLEISLEAGQASMLWGPQFRRHAAISQECQALVFFIPAGGRQVRVFADGRLVGRYANGDWSQDRMARLDETVDHLVAEKGYDFDLLQRVLRCAFKMAEQNLGAIFTIGNAEKVLAQSDAPEISLYAWISGAPLAQMSDQALINFAKQDGATVIDTDGRFHSFMVFLRPAAAATAQIGPGKGARHSSAAKISAEASCLAITVSQDGPITIYESGQRVLSV